tara:strand:+ start:316 stop:882 length:567 start_codon:yes stop_codon:yes gene_type:complete
MSKVTAYCGRQISKSNISKHRKRCSKCKTDQLEQRHEEILNEIASLKRSIENTPRVVNIVCNIIPFSHEPVLSQEDVVNLLEPADESVPRFVKLKHFVQGGGNIRIPNKSQKRIQIFTEEDGWITKDRDEFLSDLTGLSMNELDEKYFASNLSNNWKDWAMRFRNSDKQTQQKLCSQIMYTIMDNQIS